jgi:UDP-sulfoquinovose synthase
MGGQTRGMLNIRDTLACVALAVENPAERGEYRVFNQFTEQYSVRQMAEMVQRVSPNRVDIAEGLSNPRVEREEHYYNAAHTKLLDLGLHPHLLTDEVLTGILQLVERHRDRVDLRAIAPTVQWRAPASTLNTADKTSDSSFLAV